MISEEILQSIYEEELVYGDEMAALADELAVIALYKKLEIDTKKAINIVFPDKSTDNLFKGEKLKEFLTQKGIEIESLPSRSEVEELRIINNCIKHSGIVNRKLAEFKHWKEGERLENLDKHCFRLAEGAERYMTALIEKLMSHLR